MKKPMTPAEMGRKGGKAKGKRKSRGDRAYYAMLGKLSAEKRRAKK